MSISAGPKTQYEHLLTQAAKLDRAAQIDFLLDLASQMRQIQAAESEVKPDLREGRKGKDAYAQLMAFHKGRRLNELTLKDLMLEGRR
ncbi:MAG: hypothetical protein LBC90_09660 [Candidatus Adiutrix sp.]|jgi:hypothetical protein|nr:hypothetical protein [Candidatus Adiutrix sp.]